MFGSKHKTSYNDLNFSKRFDHDAGHVPKERMAEPAICNACQAIYSGGRWSLDDAALKPDPFDKSSPAESVCPACEQIKSGVPLGFVHITGSVYGEHLTEIENLIKNEQQKILKNNPLARVMEFDVLTDEMIVKTTTKNLAQHLGRALHRAYGGEVRYDVSSEERLARVYWTRD
jgi:NMD protein affecting ribosome stability and mRNA decay